MTPYEITCDKARLDIGAIHGFLSQSYWSPGIPRAIVERAVANSVCFGVLHHGNQVGFARVITDKATFAYLSDVYILAEFKPLLYIRRFSPQFSRNNQIDTLAMKSLLNGVAENLRELSIHAKHSILQIH